MIIQFSCTCPETPNTPATGFYRSNSSDEIEARSAAIKYLTNYFPVEGITLTVVNPSEEHLYANPKA